MKNFILAGVFIIAATFQVAAQCGGVTLTVNNASFEGTPAAHVTPPGWDICMPGVTPDTQPGFWGQTLPPSQGNSYLGLVHQPSSGWQEGAGQNLSSPMMAGTTYNFTIDLAVPASANPSTGILLPPHCVVLECWGGWAGQNQGCHQGELLWVSPSVTNTTWLTYNLSFVPSQNWNHILFVINTLQPNCTNGQYLFVDNMTAIVPIADQAIFTANTVCTGTPTTFSDQSTSPSSNIVTWQWNFGDGSPINNNQNPAHTYSSPGTYNVTLTIITSVPCTTSVTNTVTVNPIPALNVSASPQALCAGLPTTLAVSGANTYNWSHGLGTASTVTTVPTATTTYSVTGTSLGCSSTATVQVATGTLNISAAVLTHASCFGFSNGSAAVTSALGTPPYSYSWSPSGGNNATATGLSAGTYTVIAGDSVGCLDTAQITITEPPLLSLQVVDSTKALCYGDSSGSAVVLPNGGTPTFAFQWSPHGGISGTGIGLPAGTYTVTVGDANGCTASNQVIIEQYPQLELSLTPEDETCTYSCNGSILTNVSGGNGPYTYAWSTFPVQQTAHLMNICPGSYYVSVTDANNCKISGSTTIITNSPVSATFTAIPPAGLVPFEVNFFYQGSGASEFLWDFGNGSQSTLSDPAHSYHIAGLYTVTLIVNTGFPDYCTDTFSLTITAIQPSILNMPNVFTPNNDGFNDILKPETTAIESLQIVIYNRWGEKVYEWADVNGGWDGMHKNGSKCSDGTYYYILTAKGYDGVTYNLHGTVSLLR